MNKSIQTDFGAPEPNVCTACEEEFGHERITCPHCGNEGYYHQPHPNSSWTRELIEQLVASLAGYGVIHCRLPADHQAVFWWDDGVHAMSRGPGGAWSDFELGFDEVFEDAHTIEVQHRGGTTRSVRQRLPSTEVE